MDRFGFNRSCRFGNSQNYSTTVDSLTSFAVFDIFLLLTCHKCLQNIVSKELPSQILDYRNDSQMENACHLKKDATISHSSCLERVKACCIDAEKCCEKQLAQQTQSSGLFCPMTWDGLVCVDRTPANNTFKVKCPKFIPYFIWQNSAEKQCLEDGKWFTMTEANITWEYTNYYKCYSERISDEYLMLQFQISILILSILMLVVSLSIFLLFKSLRSQQRIRIHINLFLTLFLKSCFELINTVVITMNSYSKITGNVSQFPTIDQENQACKWITIFLRYFQNSTFCWMLCEAVFLYQLLFRTFEIISSIKIYLFIGWILPLIYTIIYVLIRMFHSSFEDMNKQCWVEEPPKLEYLMRGPNIIVMLINIILLINILYLIRNLPVQPSDRSYWKRTLKAVLVLVPLFGLQFIFVAFQINIENRFYFGYSLMQNVIQYSQGVAVSLAFCAMNQEVFTNIKQTFYLGSCNSNLTLPRNHSSNRNSNSSRHSDHFRMIPLVHCEIAKIIRRSGDQRKT